MKQELLILREHPSSPRVILVGFVLLILAFCVVLLCVFTFCVSFCDVCYDFRIKTMLGSSLPPVVCRRAHVLFVRFYLQLFVGDLMSCLFVFTSSCLLESSCLVCSSLPPVVCWRAHVLFVHLYLQLFVGELMSCLFVFTSSCL